MARIVPLYTIKGLCHVGAWPRKTMAVILDANEVFPAGTPEQWNGIRVFRGEVAHFHCEWTEEGNDMVPMGREPDGVALIASKRLGQGRKALRRFLAEFPPIDRQVEAFQLRRLVREGD